MKVYLAGPDIFFHDAERRFARLEAECRLLGFEPLRPVEGAGSCVKRRAHSIFEGNVARIQEADVVLANLAPFRGLVEPDSGTVFELGVAHALKKLTLGYGVDPKQPLKQRIESQLGVRVHEGALVDEPYGALVEDFDLPLNLMLGVSVPCYKTSLEALEFLALKRDRLR